MPRLQTNIIALPDDIEAIVQAAITEVELPARLHHVLRAAIGLNAAEERHLSIGLGHLASGA